jgi:single-strand DNA-binding protein
MNGTLNKVMLIGHLGDEVKMHYFEGGNSIGRFPIATNEVYKNKEGESITNTEWHNIVVRNRLAEICEKYLTKGDKIYCEGRIKTRQWTGEDGQQRYTTEIQVTDLTFLSNKRSEGQAPQASQPKPDTTAAPARPSEVNTEDPEDDLPF